MIPAKNRDRKCSTCRHYQPSPLWRKGWCRNPLLYDRNTNHLVEADILACNRTFIDYWEPATEPSLEADSQPHADKPRIAPSIPMSTMDAQGNRGVFTGNTPAAGTVAYSSNQALKPTPNRDAPKLSLVTPDYDPADAPPADDAPETPRRAERPEGLESDQVPINAVQRIRDARKQQRIQFLNSTTGRVALILAVLVVLALLGGGAYLTNRQANPQAAAQATPSVTPPPPTPTGFGDATATPPPTFTPAAPPPSAIGVNGWVQVQADGGLTARDAPAKAGAKLTVLPDGAIAKVVEGPKEADGITWWKLESTNPAITGWCAGQYLVPAAPPSP